LFVIATFPSLHIDIEKYPAIKNHLLSFGMERLEQTGKSHKIKGELIQARKKTTNKWYETSDTIAYWEDFNKQKIVWGNLALSASFAEAPGGIYVNAPCPMIVPYDPYLLAVLNSKLGDWYIRHLGVTRNGGYFEYKPCFVEKLPVPEVCDADRRKISSLIVKVQSNKSLSVQEEIDALIYQLYGLSVTEIESIECSH